MLRIEYVSNITVIYVSAEKAYIIRERLSGLQVNVQPLAPGTGDAGESDCGLLNTIDKHLATLAGADTAAIKAGTRNGAIRAPKVPDLEHGEVPTLVPFACIDEEHVLNYLLLVHNQPHRYAPNVLDVGQNNVSTMAIEIDDPVVIRWRWGR